MKKVLSAAMFLVLLFPVLAKANGNQLDYPHSATNNVKCAECHYTGSLTLLDPAWTNDPPAHIDDLPFNNFCWNCHDGSAAQAVETHSSRTTTDKYGQWNIECRTCHWPHHIMQYREYGAESFDASGASLTVTSSTLTVAGNPWTANQFQGYILMPDTAKETFNYKIASNTENEITVTGAIDINEISAGRQFGIIYGNLVKATISTPNSGDKQVKFFRNQGVNSFADGDTEYNGPCEVCHTKTNHFRNNGTGSEQNHENIDGGKEGSNCVGICHSHANGFAHGQGSGGADGCVQCHGHEAGTAYDPDMQFPYTPGVSVSQGKGTTKSHSTHTEVDSDDAKGPAIYCDDCHDVNNIPYFKAGVDGDGDGRINLAETTVCDTCHTPGGMVDGINDPAVGVKNNWRNGIYEADSTTLASGKDLWCISCHDEDPSNSKPDGSGVAAPNKAGDGSSWGYYLTGHGNNGPYNATLHGQNGPAYVCTVCHDAGAAHFDHVAGATRLKAVLDDGLDYTTSVSEVCLDCHVVGQTNPGALGFDSVAEATVHSGGVSGGYNALDSDVFPSYGDAADYSANPGYQCDDCHEVHGTSKLAMVIETIDGNVGGESNPVAVQGFEASDANMIDLDPTAAADDGVCDVCHAAALNPHPDTNRSGNHNLANNDDGCVRCHNHRDSFRHGGGAVGVGCGSADTCHGIQKAHPTHVGSNVAIGCDGCHDVNDFPNFKSGVDGNGDGKYNLAETTACDQCHTPEGAILAKQNFGVAGGWSAGLGEASYCGSCHDETPGSFGGATAPNVIGDNASYGFFVTGHGRTSAQGNYPALIWQDAAADGNAPANRACGDCHDHSLPHFNVDPALKRLKAGWDNDENNSNCYQCHDESSSEYIASSSPKYFTDIASYAASAHGQPWMPDPAGARRVKCTDCHEVHGAAKDANGNGLPGMAKGEQENLCYQCHTDGLVVNFSVSAYKGTHTGGEDQTELVDANAVFPGALSSGSIAGWIVYNLTDGSKGAVTGYLYDDYGPTSVPTSLTGGIDNDWDSGDEYRIVWEDDIEHAFASTEIHDLGTPFGIGTKTYSLECVSCHNVHTVTGKYWDAEAGLSPVTRFPPDNPANFSPWGDEAGEKMDDYAGSGTYRTPNSETFGGADLPDYPTFCLDCHGQSSGHANFGIDWNNDPHGKDSANSPNGYGVCPNWYTCGKAEGWDGDECVGGEEACWPVMTRGLGDQLWSRKPFNHEERIAGANFTLSCTNCHEAHGAESSSMVRPNPNNGKGTIIWNDMCNNCHFYYSDWHAGMSCGNASCHTGNSIHRIGANHGSAATRSFNRDLVFHYAFQNNLKDSGTWQMDGGWRVNAGSFAPGKVGQAIVLSDHPVEVGTENERWSTDEGYHGTWKYTDMKYNMTLEAWINPSADDGERKIMAKHTYWTGGYAMVLKQFEGSLRLGLLANVDPGVNNFWDADCNGLRGAFSRISIPLNAWTHVAATYDSTGPDRDPSDGSVGRIRLYVNGEDVTDSYSDDALCFTQPGPGETAMWPHSDNNEDPVNECYEDHWCASALSVGGLNWSAPNDNFVGMLDEVKVWNITKDADYFSTEIDPAAGPYISRVEGAMNSDQLTVHFSEGVYGAPGAADPLLPADFILSNADGRTILTVVHVPGESIATITMSAAMDSPDDFLTDALSPVPNEIFDEYDAAAETVAASIEMIAACPTGPIASIQLNETAGSAYVYDDESALFGEVFGTGTMTGAAYSGDGANNYIMFNYNQTCLQASTEMTIEARIKPTGIPTEIPAEGTSYIKRILARDGGANYQLSVWSAWNDANWPDFNPPAGQASIALWVNLVDAHGGNTWKPVLTNYAQADPGVDETSCPIVNDHWYKIKAVWDANRPGGTIDAEFVPADIFIDDQGPLGDDADQNWAGYINCTDRDQSLTQTEPNKRLYANDQISMADGPIAIGANVGNPANNLFNGQIDWITWQAAVNYDDITDGMPSMQGESAAPLSGASLEAPVSVDLRQAELFAAAANVSAATGGKSDSMEEIVMIASAGTAIEGVEGTIGSNQLLVAFSTGVFSDVGGTAPLVPSDFTLTDLDDGRIIIGVEHAAGTSTAILTLNSILDGLDDVGVDSLSVVSDGVYSRAGIPIAPTSSIIFTKSCPPGGTRFDFAEASGQPAIFDQSGLLRGFLGDRSFSLKGDGFYSGDVDEAASTFIDVDNNGQCLASSRASTLEVRFFAGAVDLDFFDLNGNGIDDDYDVGGAFSTAGDGRNATESVIALRSETFQLSVMRANWLTEDDWKKPGKARLAFKYKIKDPSTCEDSLSIDPVAEESQWKLVLSSIDEFPLVKGHWYRVRVVFNSDKLGAPVDVWADDQGTDGVEEPTTGAGELWSGFRNVARSEFPVGDCATALEFGQEMAGGSQFLHMGDDVDHLDVQGNGENRMLKGKLDWLVWKPIVDYSGVDDSPR